MTRLDEFESYDHAVYPGLALTRNDYGYTTGAYVHPLGIVRVVRFSTVTSLYLVRAKREYQRRWERYWGDKTISRLAREFLEDME